MNSKKLNLGGIVMFLGALGFVLYGIVFLFRSFSGKGFELGVSTIGGLNPEQLNALNSSLLPYLTHIHVALAAFIISTGIAVGALSLYGVRTGKWWAWVSAVISPVIALTIAIPMHYFNKFSYIHATHLGPIYFATGVFVVGAIIALKGLSE